MKRFFSALSTIAHGLTLCVVVIGATHSTAFAAGPSPLQRQQIAQERAQLTQHEQDLDALQQKQQSLNQALKKLAQDIALARAQRGSLSQSRLKQLLRRQAQLQALLDDAAQAQRSLTAKVDTELHGLLSQVQVACSAGCTDPVLSTLRQDLALRLGAGNPLASDKASLRAQILQVQADEEALRRRARMVAQRIRSLQRQRELAGEVRGSLRDQALFNEEERHLDLTQVVSREVVRPQAAGDNSQAAPTNDYATGSQDNDPNTAAAPVGGSNDTEGADLGVGAETPVEPATDLGRESVVTTTVSQQINGQSVDSLLAADLPALLAEAGDDEDLQTLRGLRDSLVQEAERLASERQELEIRARGQREQ